MLIYPAYAAGFGLSRNAEVGEFTHALPISMDQKNPMSSRQRGTIKRRTGAYAETARVGNFSCREFVEQGGSGLAAIDGYG